MTRIRPLHTFSPPAALLVGWLAATLCGPALAQAPVRPVRGLELADVRAVFTRVDADADGHLDRREADHGGIDALQFPRHDADGDGRLDAEEFVVARHALLATGSRPSAADLSAEATRIRASWRARRASDDSRGPASRVRAAQRTGSQATGDRKTPATPPSDSRPSPSYPPEMAGGLPGGLGLSRLRRTTRGEEHRTAGTLEERARAAQELIQARLRDREGLERAPAVVSAVPGPGSRASRGAAGRSATGSSPVVVPQRNPASRATPARPAPAAKTQRPGPAAGRTRPPGGGRP